MQERAPRRGSVRELGYRYLPTRPLHWIGVVGVTALVALVVGVTAIVSGLIDTRASPPHHAGLAGILHYTFGQSVAARSGDVPEPPAGVTDLALVELAAGHYANSCSNCHAAPGLGQNPVALSMRPEPPKLDESNDRWTDRELFAILRDGVAFSAMPAWPVENRPEEVWAMVRFVQALDDMTFEEYVDLAYNRRPVEAGGEAADETLADLPQIAFGATPEEFSVPRPAADEAMERPYLPGDIQESTNIEGAGDLHPTIGFVPNGLDGNALQICVQCHGAEGEGRENGVIPNLTLQNEDYLYRSLAAYAYGDRQSGIMWSVAAQLSEPQMREIASFIGNAAPVPSPTTTAPAPELVARGQEVAERGVPLEGAEEVGDNPDVAGSPDMQVYACRGCHGAEGASARVFPALDGQHAGYIAMQLNAFRNGGRGANNSYDPTGIASHENLSDEDVAAAAAYFASLPPRDKESEEAGLR